MKLKQRYFAVSTGMATAIALAASGCLKKSESTLTSDAGIQISPDKLSYGFTEDFLMRVFSQNNMDRNAVAGELVAIVRADWRETLPLKSRLGDFKKFGELKKDDDITAVGSVAISSLAEFGKHFQVRSLNPSDASAYEFVRLKVSDATPEGLRKAINELHTLNAIQFAEPNYEAKLIATPNEPLFASLWGLRAINAPAAWDLTTGTDKVTVAVIDSGVDYTHPDLVANIWSNPKEVENQIDDDGNGFVDDIRGWNFWDGNNNPMDRYGHGTHVAGIIGARGNNVTGVAGVSWSTKLMPIKVFSDAGQSMTANIINGILYAANNGAQILNNSYSSGMSVALTNAVIHSRDKNTLFVAGAGNDGTAGALYPASLSTSVENVISVASTDANNALSTFSNYGDGVNIAAPGGQILSTFPSNRLVYLSGTSMAAPHVAGVAALMLSHSPNTSALEIKDAILTTGQPVPELANRVQSGLLNARAALDQVTPVPAPNLTAGLKFKHYLAVGKWTDLPNFNKLKPSKKGTIANFSLSPRTRKTNYGFRFDGLIKITTAGTYQFFTTSDDGSKLWINDQLVVDNGGQHNRRERSGTIDLPQGHHKIRVDYFQSTKKNHLSVRYQGPGITKTKIPARVLFHNP